jgi:hypothetical protein
MLMLMLMLLVFTISNAIAAVKMLVAPAEQEHADDVHDQTKRGDRNSFVETDRHRPDEARYRFIADQ